MQCGTCKEALLEPCTSVTCGHTVCRPCAEAIMLCVPPLCVLCGSLAPQWPANLGLAASGSDGGAAAAAAADDDEDLCAARARLAEGYTQAQEGCWAVTRTWLQLRAAVELAKDSHPSLEADLCRMLADRTKLLRAQAAELESRASVLGAGAVMPAGEHALSSALALMPCIQPFPGPCASEFFEVVCEGDGRPPRLRKVWADLSQCTVTRLVHRPIMTERFNTLPRSWLEVRVVDDLGRPVPDLAVEDVGVAVEAVVMVSSFEGSFAQELAQGPLPHDGVARVEEYHLSEEPGCVRVLWWSVETARVTVTVRGDPVPGWLSTLVGPFACYNPMLLHECRKGLAAHN